jgi:DNA end-binding protein Ku
MARALWKGAISFGLVTVPVSLHAATESKEELSFHMLHKPDGSRIEFKRFCKEEGKEVAWSEIMKAYEVSQGRYVVVTEEDFAKARVPATQTFEVRELVPAEQLDYLYFDHPYYVAPAGKVRAKAYALLRDALQETGKVGIGTIVLRQREHLGALGSAGEALVLTTMRFAHEIRSPEQLDLPGIGQGWTKKEMELAHQLIESLASDWDPKEYKDTYTEVLREVIEKKAAGEEVTVPAVEERPAVTNLMKALEESLKSRKGLAKASGRATQRRATRPRRGKAA